MNDDFLDVLSCMSFAISVANYRQNLEQSSNDDLMKEIDERTQKTIEQITAGLNEQNEMLRKILKRLEGTG